MFPNTVVPQFVDVGGCLVRQFVDTGGSLVRQSLAGSLLGVPTETIKYKRYFLDDVYFVSSLAAMCKAQTRLAMVTRRSHNRDTQTRKVTQKFSPDIVHYYGYI